MKEKQQEIKRVMKNILYFEKKFNKAKGIKTKEKYLEYMIILNNYLKSL